MNNLANKLNDSDFLEIADTVVKEYHASVIGDSLLQIKIKMDIDTQSMFDVTLLYLGLVIPKYQDINPIIQEGGQVNVLIENKNSEIISEVLINKDLFSVD